jgi:hypothetical protein
MQDNNVAQDQYKWKEFYRKWHELVVSVTKDTFEERL